MGSVISFEAEDSSVVRNLIQMHICSLITNLVLKGPFSSPFRTTKKLFFYAPIRSMHFFDEIDFHQHFQRLDNYIN